MKLAIERPLISTFALTALVLLLVLAIQASSQVQASEASNQYVEVMGEEPPAQEDEVRGPESYLPYLFAVYTITWIAFFAYAFLMSRRQRDMRRELDALRRVLDEREKQD